MHRTQPLENKLDTSANGFYDFIQALGYIVEHLDSSYTLKVKACIYYISKECGTN